MSASMGRRMEPRGMPRRSRPFRRGFIARKYRCCSILRRGRRSSSSARIGWWPGGAAGRKRPCSNSTSRCAKSRGKFSRKPPGERARSRNFRGKRSDCRGKNADFHLCNRPLTSDLSQNLRYIKFMPDGSNAVVRPARAVREVGCDWGRAEDGSIEVHGVGPRLRTPTEPLDCGNSGSTMRMLSGILAGQPFTSELRGDESLSRRPMARIMTPLSEMGAKISSSEGGRPPLKIIGGPLKPIHYRPEVASAQVKSCVLFAGLFAAGETVVEERSEESRV